MGRSEMNMPEMNMEQMQQMMMEQKIKQKLGYLSALNPISGNYIKTLSLNSY